MRFVFLIIVSMLFSACSSVRIVPEQAANGRINPVDNSQTITSKTAEVTARVDEAGINSYNLDSFVTSIHLSIKNISSSEIAFSENSFVIVDENNLQYELLSPDRVREMLKKDSYYLMPYPYVGFYYLEDYQKTNFYNRHNSSLPYYYELYPQDIYSRALPMIPVIPGMKTEGLTYFKIDPALHKNFKLLIYTKEASKSSPPDFSFPFRIDK